MTIRVLIAEDQPLVRAGLKGIVETAPDLTVVGEAGNGSAAIEQVVLTKPDVVLMDIRMPGMDGLQATEVITRASSARVLILTTFDLDEYVYTALRSGASGFLLKDTPLPELLAGIRVIAAGEALLGPSITRRLIDEFAQRAEPTPRTGVRLAAITDREREVLLQVSEGSSNAEIAAALHIEIGTVKTHIAHLLTKLDARDRVQLVILAFRSGLARTS
ncbi:response regulator [Kribbella sp. GL6]|uniref:response regulator n=1 Tax=Kribbella sp. GL6 TaxID=3419765 RepID=UPI003CFF37EF